MRTEKRKTNLADVSAQQAKQQMKQQKKEKRNGVSPSPILGILVGFIGTAGSIIAWIANAGLLPSLFIALAGCIGAAMCRGTNGDYDSAAARWCMSASVTSALTAMIILTVYLKSINFLGVFFK